MGGVASSFDVAEEALKVVGEIPVSDRQINKLTCEFGQQLQEDRDTRTREYVDQNLPRRATQVEPPVDLAVVFFDGGRMRTRHEGQGVGVHEPHWRETKNAGFHRMQSESFDADPQPDLPDCFRNQSYVEKLVKGLKNLKKEGREDPVTTEPELADTTPDPSRKDQPEWQPKTLFRTCISSLSSSDEFGPMMAAEADARGFFAAKKKAFVADGQACNWTIHRRWFAGFVAITDFVHVVEYIYSAAKAVNQEAVARWHQYVAWATACWQGHVDEVIEQLRVCQEQLGRFPTGEELSDTDPRATIQAVITYFTNNRSRMDYARYRCQGLPVTSALAESLVKQINHRVKGTDKFWNDGSSGTGEGILQIRAAVLCEDARLARWMQNRPISPFSPCCRNTELKTAA